MTLVTNHHKQQRRQSQRTPRRSKSRYRTETDPLPYHKNNTRARTAHANNATISTNKSNRSTRKAHQTRKKNKAHQTRKKNNATIDTPTRGIRKRARHIKRARRNNATIDAPTRGNQVTGQVTSHAKHTNTHLLHHRAHSLADGGVEHELGGLKGEPQAHGQLVELGAVLLGDDAGGSHGLGHCLLERGRAQL